MGINIKEVHKSIIVLLLGFGAYSLVSEIPWYESERNILASNQVQKNLTIFIERMFNWKALLHRPFSLFLTALNFELFGHGHASFRLINLFIHLANSILVLKVAKYFTPSNLLASLIFALHPLATGGVVPLFARNYSLGLFFMLLAYDIFLKKGGTEDRPISWDRKSLSLFLLATTLMLLCKQTFVFFFGILLLHRLSHRPLNWATIKKEFKSPLIVLGSIVTLTFIVLYAEPYSATASVTSQRYLISQIGNLFRIISIYVLPFQTSTLLYLPFFKGVDFQVIFNCLCLFLGLASALIYRKINFAFFLVCFFISIVPTNSVFAKEQVLIQWRIYPSLLFFGLSLTCFYDFLKERSKLWPAVTALLFKSLPFILVPGLFAHSFYLIWIYTSEVQAYEHHLKVYPKSLAGMERLAWLYMQSENWEAALENLEMAKKIKPGGPDFLKNLSKVHYMLGNKEEVSALEARFDEITSKAWAEKGYFGQAQSSLKEFLGVPLISGNWEGQYSPYLYLNGSLVSMMPNHLRPLFRGIDFYRPEQVLGDSVLMSGQARDSQFFDLYLYRLKEEKLINLTNTPQIDEGDQCLEGDLLSYRSGSGQKFAMIEAQGLKELSNPNYPGLHNCVWESASRLYGVAGRRPPYQLFRCDRASGSINCTPDAALKEVIHFISFFKDPKGRIGILALKHGNEFRRPYILDDGKLIPYLQGPEWPEADVLEIEGNMVRTGLHGRYNLGTDSLKDGPTFFKLKRIGYEVFSIMADTNFGKTLGVKDQDGHWRAIHPPTAHLRKSAAKPIEVWLRSPLGKLFQGFYFGQLNPKKAVLWIHGGPKESISPRFNPYFHRLNEMGFGVMAINYPGSTGRGASFESQLSESDWADSIAASLTYLRSQGIDTIVAWSISSGSRVQRAMLKAGLRVSGIIDQAGGDNTELNALAKKQNIPYFTVRGKSDFYGKENWINHFYNGGHDITDLQQFIDLFKALRPFWERLKPLAPTNEHTKYDLILDPGHVGNDSDPNHIDQTSEAYLTFMLAHELIKQCFTNSKVLLTRWGSVGLLEREAQLKNAVADIRSRPHIPAISLHFNASNKKYAVKNESSVFVPFKNTPKEVFAAQTIIDSLAKLGVGPKNEYPELEGVPLKKLSPGVFARGLAVLKARQAPTLLIEPVYYDESLELSRLNKRVLTSDGEWEHPRLNELALALCPAGEEVLGRE